MKLGSGIISETARGTVEETLNALLDAEADRLCGAARYERSQARQDTPGGSYERPLHTVAGEVNLRFRSCGVDQIVRAPPDAVKRRFARRLFYMMRSPRGRGGSRANRARSARR
jgi:hypothetical protein